MISFEYLGFEPVEYPTWRSTDKIFDSIPSVSTMISEILQYRRTWIKLKKANREQRRRFEEVQREMYLEFLYKVQIGEDIGVQNRKAFNVIAYDEDNNLNEKRGLKRRRSSSRTDTDTCKYRCHKSDSMNSFEDKAEEASLPSSQASNNANVSPSQNSSNSPVDDSPPYSSQRSNQSLPSSQDVRFLLNLEADQKRTLETINLLRGYHHLSNEVKKIPKDERKSYIGIIDVDVCIKKCHEILMNDLLDKDKTPPGRFSTLPRTTEFEGQIHFYPTYKTEDVAFDAIQVVVDQYNTMIAEVSKIENSREKLKNSFKCASVLLFSFLSLHPFSDGNGRLARLLCNHCLKTFCPFPTAIYNNFSPSTRSDFIKALISARQGLSLSPNQLQFSNDSMREALQILDRKPSELCALVIESNWFTWRHFLRKIGFDIGLKDFESVV